MISRRVLFALQWTLATTLAVVIANLIIEILLPACGEKVPRSGG